MLNAFPRWKFWLLGITLVIGLIYALPNIYGEDPAVQIMPLQNAVVDQTVQNKISDSLISHDLKYKSIRVEDNQILLRFSSTQTQLAGRDLLKDVLGKDYSVALNLAPATPRWLSLFGAEPMKLGLDLRGGVRFLMEVDVSSNIKRRLESSYNDLRGGLRQENIRYTSLNLDANSVIKASFASKQDREQAIAYINKKAAGSLDIKTDANGNGLELSLPKLETDQIRNTTMDQTVSTLRNRVNELGVAEAIVQREGLNKVVVELPGIQDTARAKDILGKTATLDFMMEDGENDLMQALQGRIPPGSKIFYMENGRPLLLKNRVILSGDSIVSATSQYDSQDHRPVVAITLGGSGINLFRETTLNNIGKNMAVVYRESDRPDRVISYATIQSALGNNFQISGLSQNAAKDLALLLRAGALPAKVSIVEERIIGPSMGQENINKGITSVIVGFSLVVIFMTIYYSLFGILANLALLMNLVLLLALLSLVGATLTLPGIAGIVLTLGMAVDANVLIFERIREELRIGMSPHGAIQRGFDHAFSTIIDSNLTTLIVGIILYSIGTGPVKGFAVTLSLGILTSLFTSITGTRAIVELVYGKRQVQKLMVGI